MSKTRKFLGILLAITLIINVFAVAAYALSSEGDGTTHKCSWSLNSAAFTTAPANGDNFTVDVLLYTSYKSGLIQFELEYDKTAFTVVSIAAGPTYATAFPNAAVQGNADTTGAKGLYKVNMIPKTEGVSTLPAIIFGTEEAPVVLATVTFTYNGGSGTIAVVDDYKSETNVGGTLCAYRTASGNMVTNTPDSNFVCGQNSTVAPASPVGGAVVTETLVAKASTTGFVDTARGYVYGVTPSDDPADYFQTSTGGAVTFVANSAGSTTGTGATVTVGGVTYTLVIFGDVNGDALVGADDSQAVKNAVASKAALTGAYFFAANVVEPSSEVLDAADASAVQSHASAKALLTINPFA